MYGYIYLTTNLINNKKYIGQHKSNVFDNNYIGSGILLAKAIKKYGKEYFTCKILECCDTKKELNEKEKYWISYYDATNSNDFYNIAFGGEGGEMPRECIEKAKTKISKANKGKKRTKEQIQKMSKVQKKLWEDKNYRKKYIESFKKRKKVSQETREKMSIAHKGKLIGEKNPMYGKISPMKGKKHTKQSREKISLANKGKFTGKKNPMYGRKHTDEAKAKISKANKGRIHTEETKRKMSESHKHKRGTYKRRYDCICKECGNKFQGLAWNSGICNKCKDK